MNILLHPYILPLSLCMYIFIIFILYITKVLFVIIMVSTVRTYFFSYKLLY